VKTMIVALAAAISLAVAAPVAAASQPIPVQATKASVASWVQQAKAHDMRAITVFDLGEGVELDCGITAAGSSDCARIDSNADGDAATQEVQVGDKGWVREIPGGPWRQVEGGSSENPVGNVSRYWSYDPFEPWTAGKGVTWKMREKANGDVVIISTNANPGDDEPTRTRVAISPNGLHFSITAKAANGNRLWRTTGTLVDNVVVTAPAS